MSKWILLVLAALLAALLLWGRLKSPGPEEVPRPVPVPTPTPTPAPHPGMKAGLVKEEGEFVMLVAGSPVGEERYRLEGDAQGLSLTSEVDLSILGQKAALQTTLELSAWDAPQSYSLKADTPQGKQELLVAIDWASQEARLRAEAGGRRIEHALSIESPLFVIDNNVSSHFVVLYRALRAPGGARPIKGMALAPQPMLTVPLRAEPSGPAALIDKTTGERIEVESFRVQLGDLALTLYGRGDDLLAIDNPAQRVFVYRSDLLPEGAEIAAASEAAEAGKSESPPPGLREFELSFESDGLTLVGTLTLPEEGEGPFPAVLMVHGSGALDRDESAPGFPLDFFKEVAYTLAQEGIASFRYDKRGVGKSEGDLSRAGMRDLVKDARAALKLLRSREEVDPHRVFVLGHSEGGILAPLLAAEGGVAGVVLVAAPARPLDAVLLEQARRIAEAMGLPPEQVEAQVRQTRRFIEFVKATEGEEALSSKELKGRFPWLTEEMLEAYKSLSLKWFREHFRHDPLRAVRFVRVPVLILHGEKDLQVAPYHAERLAKALRGAGNEDVTLKILPDLNHLLRHHPEPPSIAYRHLDEPVDERVLRLIADWVKEHLGS